MKIIAELGSNFRTYQDLKNSIHLAFKAGANAIKFQCFSEHDLYGQPGNSRIPNIPIGDIPLLKEEADRIGIEFMCTIFTPDKVNFFDKYLDTWKVSSGDMCYDELLTMINRTGKPVILSTGSHKVPEITRALEVLSACEVTLLYCISAYPANRLWLQQLEALYMYFGKKVGLSDHSTDVFNVSAHAAHKHDAAVLEKHFNPFDYSTADSPHSLSFNDFRDMVTNIRGKYDERIGARPEEKDMLTKYNRRLIATMDIKEGEKLRYGFNYGAFRSKEDDFHGMNPFSDLHGKKAHKQFKAGEGVYWK